MRLTLRTLLAWLDDTLSPAEVREIGNQVAESPFAQELKDRIQLVTRQRRLTVPPSDGPQATDPNLVAAYLDNELAPEHVADFEKLCLTSDVNLAEVASVHQILSLIGQKAKVPSEARHRMYNLVKGRETVAVELPPGPEAHRARAPERAGRSLGRRPGPRAIELGSLPDPAGGRRPPDAPVLVGLDEHTADRPEGEGESAWPGRPRTREGPCGARTCSPRRPPPAVVPTPEAPKTAEAAKADGTPSLSTRPRHPHRSRADGPRRGGHPVGGTPSPADAEKKAQPRDELPEGAIGKVETSSGPLLRWNAEREEWERLNDQSPLKDRDRLLNLAPYRASLVLGTARVELVGQTEISVSTPSPDQEARFRLEAGRVVVHGGSAGNPFAVQFADRTVLVSPPAGSPVGPRTFRSARAGLAPPFPVPPAHLLDAR